MRRRQAPAIHRYSRLIVGIIALLGVANTGYLTWEKLSQAGNVCGTEACNRVLTSDFANVGNIPLTLFGLVSYITVAVLAFAPSFIDPQSKRNAHKKIDDLSWLGIFLIGTAMAVFSGYLVYLLAVVIQAACPFCIASAIFSLSIFILSIIGREWEDIGNIIFMGIASALLAGFMSLIFYNSALANQIDSLAPKVPPVKGIGWEIKSSSSPAEQQLAAHLTKSGAKMYGSYWCSHCFEQKQLFGKQAWDKVPYVECAADAVKNPQPQVCKDAGIKGFPTWVINGKLDPGVKRLADLAKLTGYTGDTKFKYDKLFPAGR
jgi:uncharacterized membrane protein